MVRYVLRCDDEHRFEAWFRSQADCEQIFASGKAICPVCERAETVEAEAGLPPKRSGAPAYQ